MASKIGTYNDPLYSELLDKAKTNTARNSSRAVTVPCPDLWTHVQEFCLTRSRFDSTREVDPNRTTNHSDHTITPPSQRRAYINRARRIAATYARFYLETESYGKRNDDQFKGRYFWMALGAFASKEVSFALDGFRAQLGDSMSITSTMNWLGRGNFWLFQDIAGWHYYNSRYGYPSFTACEPLRNWSTLHATTRTKVENADIWAAESLPKIRNLQTNKFIKVAFAAADSCTKIEDSAKKKEYQHMNLLALADHEQRMILQPLIYETEEAKADIASQRTFSAVAPGLKLTLSANDHGDYESQAHKGMKLENVEDRMKWIYGIAKLFEGYMFGEEKDYIHSQLRIMAGWL